MCFSKIIQLYYRSRRGTRLGNDEYTFSLPTIYVWLTDTSESNSIGKYLLYLFKTIVFDVFLIIYFKIFNGRSKLLAGVRFKWKTRFLDVCICFLIIRLNTWARVHFVSKKPHVKKHVTSLKNSRKTRLIWHLRFVGWYLTNNSINIPQRQIDGRQKNGAVCYLLYGQLSTILVYYY